MGATTKSGRTSGTALHEVAALAERHRQGRVRLTAQQGLVVLDVAQDATETLIEELALIGLTVRPSAFHRGTIACTGIEFCKLALVETKGRAETIRQELEKRLPDFDTPITINVNGCPNSCARFQVADIGFKGMVQKGADGDVESFQVHLGGQMGTDAAFGLKFRGLKVTADEAPDYAERVLRGYLHRREEGEAFARDVCDPSGGSMVAVAAREELRHSPNAPGDELAGASALEILTWADEQFGSGWCVTSSMADAVVPHLASRVRPGVDVLFLDTGYHFAETIGTRDAVAATMPVTCAPSPPSEPSPSRTRASVRGCTSAIPTSAARCARSCRCGLDSSPTSPGPPGCGVTRPSPAPRRRSSNGTPGARW